MDNTKIFKKGEHLFKAGDKINSIYAIQSGMVSVYIPRQKQNIEMYVAGNSQFLGEWALHGAKTHTFSALATAETKVFEIPVDFMKTQIEGSSQFVKLYARSLGERLKALTNDLKAYRMERDNSPCPPDTVPKAFGTFYHVARHLGKVDPKTNKLTVDWRSMRTYAQRVFMEPLRRLEQVLNILVKLKYAEVQIVKNEEDPKRPFDEIGFIHVSDIQLVENFCEYYQVIYFKSGKHDLLKIDESCYATLYLMMKELGTSQPDKKGVGRISYAKFAEVVKNETGIALTNLQFERLEQKGLFVKRAPLQEGGEVMISFDQVEFAKTLFGWRILREIDKWNEKGLVDMTEPDGIKKLVTGPVMKTCTGCGGSIQETNKFCPSCGAKVAA